MCVFWFVCGVVEILQIDVSTAECAKPVVSACLCVCMHVGG